MFYCNFCEYRNNTLKNYIDHRKFHRNINKDYYCGFKRCQKLFNNYPYLITHLIRNHGYYSKSREKTLYKEYAANATGKYICDNVLCKQECSNFADLLKHLKLHISQKEQITCPYKNCRRTYKVLSSFTGHLTRSHKKFHLATTFLNKNCANQNSNDNRNIQIETSTADHHDTHCEDQNDIEQNNEIISND